MDEAAAEIAKKAHKRKTLHCHMSPRSVVEAPNEKSIFGRKGIGGEEKWKKKVAE